MPLINPSQPAVSWLGPDATLDRKSQMVAVTMATGLLRLGYLRATRTETVTSVRLSTQTTAAAATPTLCRVGVYSVSDADESLTLVGSTTNDTTLFAAASTKYTKALTAPFTKVAGTRYAVGVLVVSGAAVPSFQGLTTAGGTVSEAGDAPRICASIASQTDLPSSLTDAALSNAIIIPYIALVP